MVNTSTDGLEAGRVPSYDRRSQLKEFDDSKVGVQGLVEKGVTKVPPIFRSSRSNLSEDITTESNAKLTIPTIDLTDIHDDLTLRDDVVGKLRYACQKWGFFQVINHGIPTHVLDEMIKGISRFHEQDAKVRKKYYTRDLNKKVLYLSNFSLYKDPSTDWRDTLAFFLTPNPPKAEELPEVCRYIVPEYTTKVVALASTLFGLVSEALGLDHLHLKEMGCEEGHLLLCHYYPACPEPELTMGTSKHTDGAFMTILLQDQMGGLQILHENQWIDVPPIHGALVVNIGDLLQLVSNDKFISVQHRVLPTNLGSRTSIASFFRIGDQSPENLSKVLGPIKELLSENNPPSLKMVVTSTNEVEVETVSSYDRKSELKTFDDSKAGVQGLVENGVAKVPRMFYYEHSNDLSDGLASAAKSKISIPAIDLTGIHDDPNLRDGVVRKVRYACEKWGFFQVINHGIPTHVLDEMIKGTGRFHQQDAEVRKEYYTRDFSRKVAYLSNYTLYEDPSADWRDTIAFSLAPDHPKAEEFPAVCRDIVIEYSKKIMVLAYASLFELLSEALGLDRFYLKEKGCAEGLLLLCNFYPACPEPALTMGNKKHSDGNIMTILLQDQMGGLQVLHDSQWIDVPSMHGALVVNVGDLLQLMTNDKFISVQHRVLAKNQGPRISVASFFRIGISRVFGPIKELICEDHPPLYRDVSLRDYMAHRYASGSGTSALLHFKL
ncbi:unnamed protein product [Sphenostylis stenocarpa]|uniref:Fe2OG dioxygenase domain-containing protein n=1 Tax=Sphenostylis stenocarpa TaxID=92480 RepID=A0AA86SNW6_9FABA|nr:unnamed protein product [Sphenostylis stenocarpa]